jgi:diguanylate cyclase (GGDEF)-like protein
MESQVSQPVPQVFSYYEAPPQNDPEYDATHDELTGLLNHRGMNQAIDYLDANMHGNYGVISMDLDKLKPTNDILGYAAGDKLLQKTADVIRNTVRTEQDDKNKHRRQNDTGIVDIIGSRRGGDEFIILLPGAESQRDVQAVEKRIQDSLVAEKIDASTGSSSHVGTSGYHTVEVANSEMQQNKKKRREESFNALPRHKRLIAQFGDVCIRFAGVRPPR